MYQMRGWTGMLKYALLALLFTGLAQPTQAQAGGDLWAGIEIGSRTVKAVVIRVNDVNAKEPTELIYTKERTESIVRYVKDNMYPPNAIDAAANAVAGLYEDIRKHYPSLGPERFYLIASSGVDKAATNASALIEGVQGKLPACRPLEIIKVNDEVKYTILGTIPIRKNREATLEATMVIDLGGGNTKFGCLHGTTTFEGSINLGSNSLLRELGDKLKPENLDRNNYLKKLNEEGKKAPNDKLRSELKNAVTKMENTKGWKKRPSGLYYLSGGIPFALTRLLDLKPLIDEKKPGEEEDIEDVRVYRIEKKHVAKLIELVLSDAPESIAKVQSMEKLFAPESLLAGAYILEALFNEFGKDEFYFVKDTHLAVITGFILDKRKKGLAEGAKGQANPNEDERLKGLKEDTQQLRKDTEQLRKDTEELRTNPIVKATDLESIQKKLDAILKNGGGAGGQAQNYDKRLANIDQTLNNILDQLNKRNTVPVRLDSWELFHAGLQQYQEGRYTLAHTMLDLAIRTNDSEPTFWYALALVEVSQGRSEMARSAAKQFVVMSQEAGHQRGAVAHHFERFQGGPRHLVEQYVAEARTKQASSK